MSRPKYWWDGTVKKAMRLYYQGGLDIRTIQGSAMHIGITRALDQTSNIVDGDARIQIIELCYMCNNLNLDQASYIAHTSPRTAQRWISDFVRLVGRNIGYL